MTKAVIPERFICAHLLSCTVGNPIGFILVINISKKEAHAQSLRLRPSNAVE